MRRHLLLSFVGLLLAVFAQARTIKPAENQLYWGYFSESDFSIGDFTIGTGSAMPLMAAIYIPAHHEFLSGKTIKGVRIYISPSVASNLNSMRLWISKSLPDKLGDADFSQTTLGTLTGGANDFSLKTPYEVTGDEGFYVGYSVNSTTGYFIRSGGDAEANAFFVGNPEKGLPWQDLGSGSLGKLAFQLLVEGEFVEYSASPSVAAKPLLASKGKSVDVPVSIQNSGKATIEELSYVVEVDRTASEERTISSLSIPFNERAAVTIPVETVDEEGEKTYTIVITKVNGNDNASTQNAASVTINAVENLKTWPRNVLIEEFTTEYCVYCPDAAAGLSAFLSTYPKLADRVAVACHHAGYYTDWLTINASTLYTWFYNSNGTYAPAFMYDRYAWDGKTPVVSREAGADGYRNRVENRINEQSYANIELDARLAGSTVEVTARCERGWNFSSTPARITLYLTEDNIAARSQSGANGTFTHQHVLRAVNETWGTPLEWADDKATYTYTFRLDSSWKEEDLKVIAFISAYDSNDPTNSAVENAAVVVPATSTSVSLPSASDSQAQDIYSADGRKLPAAQQGINIIRTADGTVRKVIVK